VHFNRKANQANWQAIFGQMERMSPERVIVGEARSFKPFTENGCKSVAMKWEIGKRMRISPTHQHNDDDGINLQKQ
jgi:hypothetical protein